MHHVGIRQVSRVVYPVWLPLGTVVEISRSEVTYSAVTGAGFRGDRPHRPVWPGEAARKLAGGNVLGWPIRW